MKKLIQKIFAKIFNSSYVRGNPFIFGIDRKVNEITEKERTRKIEEYASLVLLGKDSGFYEETVVYNASLKRENIVIGEGTHIRGELLVQKYGGKIKIGDNSYVGTGTKIWSGESITIGNDVLISHNCNIIDTNSHEIDHIERAERHRQLIKSGPWENKGSIQTKPIAIGDHAWISFNVTVLKGVTIGEGAIIAAGSVITKDIPPFTLVAGNPARIIKTLLDVNGNA